MRDDYKRRIEVVIRDTLFERRVECDCCIVYDPASAELEEYGPAALPIISSIILSEVEGKCNVFDQVRNDGYPGLLAVMKCFFMISDRFSLHDAGVVFAGVVFLKEITSGMRLAKPG